MGEVHAPRPVLLILAAFSRHDDAIQWAKTRAASEWRGIALESDLFDFDDTSYYESTMGPGLRKMFLAFEKLIDAEELVDLKHQTNRWEQQYAAASDHAEPRPLNLDPGYITEAKLVLATTKDRDHRIYVSRGIYAEGTLHYHGGQWRARPWTYADYQRDEYHRFFTRCRDYLRKRYREG